jgi:multidrug efflux pump subunit AcrB
MALYHTNRSSILNGLHNLSKPTAFASHITLNGHYYPVMLKERQATDFSAYDLFHRSIQLDSLNKIRIDKLGYLELRNTNSSIHKEDRQYIRVVGFEYMGTMNFGTAFLEKTLKDMKTQLPVGYTAEKEGWQDGWSKSASWGSLVLLLLLSVFFICSVLFENFRQAAVTMGMIPVSFIGLFLTFALGEFYFDQGGYAAFILLGGLVTNACIFVINDLNRLRKKRPHADPNKLLIKAAMNRSRTILLTTTCTCCGLIPFVLHGQQEVFWFSLSVGMIGGLLFSLLAVFLILPVFCWKRSRHVSKAEAWKQSVRSTGERLHIENPS